MASLPVWLRLLLACVALVATAGDAIGQGATFADGRPSYVLVRSEATGYFFFYDPTEWELTERSSDAESDTVRFSDGDADVLILAIDAPGVTPEECLRQAIDGVRSGAGVIDAEPLPATDTLTGNVAGIAVEELAVTVADGDRREKFAVRRSCQPIDEGQSLLLRSVVVPARVYNERQQFLGNYGPETLTPDMFGPAGAAPIRNAAGQTVATMNGVAWCPVKDLVVLARNVSAEPFKIDPAAFVTVDGENGARSNAPVVEWSYPGPGIPAEAPLVVQAGGLALLQVEITGGSYGDVLYAPPDGDAAVIASFQRACGGGFGAPLPIDME